MNFKGIQIIKASLYRPKKVTLDYDLKQPLHCGNFFTENTSKSLKIMQIGC